MIIKRKLFSKKLTAEEKKQRAADQIDKNRKGVATAHGILAGGTVAGVGLIGSDVAKSVDEAKINDQYLKHSGKLYEKYRNELDKIRKTGKEVFKRANEKMRTGEPVIDSFNELDNLLKVQKVEKHYLNMADKKLKGEEDILKKATKKLEDKVSKKASKRNKKILAGTALLGTAAGLASNHLMKKRAEKLRENKFSKADDDLDEETYLGMSEEFDDSKFSRKSDKWLKERARYDEGLTDKEKENIKKNNKRLIAATSVSGASIGLAKKLSLKRGLIGAGIGAATGAGIAAAGHLHHKSEARKARKELERREKED